MLPIYRSDEEDPDLLLFYSVETQSASELLRHETERRPLESIHDGSVG